jgi:hypothetical protein
MMDQNGYPGPDIPGGSLYGFTRRFFTDHHFFVGSLLICLGLLTFSSGRYLV